MHQEEPCLKDTLQITGREALCEGVYKDLAGGVAVK